MKYYWLIINTVMQLIEKIQVNKKNNIKIKDKKNLFNYCNFYLLIPSNYKQLHLLPVGSIINQCKSMVVYTCTI